MKSKKVVLFIVEGISDKNSLALILSRLLKNERIEFHVIHGDITTRTDTTIQNCIKKVNTEIIKFLNINRFKRSDILRIVHLVDTDGAYIDDKLIKQHTTDNFIYTTDNILTRNTAKAIDRNNKKSKILNKLWSTSSISKTEYRMYYFSCNLEHVLHDEQNLNDNLKDKYSDDFVEYYYGKEEKFLDFINNSEFSVKGNYDETWSFIKQGKNSLNRYCNLNVYFKQYYDNEKK
ncbi:hypothetical protein [Haloimpatiens lingqiaonensis]|uniref:hypothetical protein n=1 Tax=Haloimpatiens lingqiaonensis TaxID=1380675 RepID=UPI0010FDB517|nr:hypothetical protein [Haloimpatiens lingqiaonensis]